MSLITDLQNAGLPVISTNGETQATFNRLLTDVETDIYLDILFPYRQAQRLRKQNAVNEAFLANELKSITPAQAVTYIENNVTSLATAKIVLKIMVRMLIAMRDEVWPSLPEK